MRLQATVRSLAAPADRLFGQFASAGLVWLLTCWAMMMPLAQLPTKPGDYLVYFAVWLGYGLLAHTASVLLVSEVFLIPYYLANGWVAGIALFFVFGVWMVFTPYTRKAPAQSGLSATLACIVACGPTMTLVFAFFPGNPLWMAVITEIMYARACSRKVWAVFGQGQAHNQRHRAFSVTRFSPKML